MKKSKYFLGLILVITLSCQVPSVDDEQKLTDLIDTYQEHQGFDKSRYPLGLYTQAYYAQEAQFADSLRRELTQLSTLKFDENDQISAALLAFVLQEKIDFYSYDRYLNPILSDAGFHSNLTYQVKPFNDFGQVKSYLNKLNAIPEFVDQHFINLRAGLEKGVSQPLVIFEGYQSTYEDHIVSSYDQSYYYEPFKKLPHGLTLTQKDSVLAAAKLAIETQVIPQFIRIKNFFESVYLPNTRTTLGISEIPNGREYYQNRIDFYTTSTEYTAESIHQIGLSEVKRIKTEMEQIIEDLEFKGSFEAFLTFLRTDKQFYATTPKELLMIARDMAKRVDAQLPRFFKTLPRKPYGVAPVPDAIAPKYTGGRYVGTDAESPEPGYYWVNTYNLPSRALYTLPSLTVHEAVPGHHLQGSLNAELGGSIPQFRRDLYLSAFGEGWGLYSEFLAEEMGMYTTL